MGNKINSSSNSRLVDNKLAIILGEVSSNLKDSPQEEREQLLIDFNKTLDKFYKTLSTPILNRDEFRRGVLPDYRKLNEKFLEVDQDLRTLFGEINSMHGFIVQNFNTLNTLSSAIRARIRRVSSDIGDYRLYAEDRLGGALHFSDFYSNTDKIDYADRLYRDDKCFVDIFSGNATLPLDPGKTETHTVETVSIGSSSNGVPGNNQEIGSLKRDRLQALTDEEPDTWYEYESVNREQNNTPLLLELKLELESESIVNTLNISTTTFATKKHPKITRLEVSIDGTTFTSIMDEIADAVSAPGSSGKIINLDSSSSKSSESNKFYFDPKKIKYINMVVAQNDSYIIRTSTGTAYRKAIGIRGVDILGQAFKKKGELVSINHQSNREIGKLALTSDIKQSIGLTEAKHYISNNDGQDWYEIESLDSIQQGSPEILDFNLGTEESIQTQAPVTAFRYRTILERSTLGFNNRGGTVVVENDKTEFLNINPGTQAVTLTEKPERGTVNLHNVSYGSVGGDNFFFVPSSQVVLRDNRAFAYLPDDPFFRQSIGLDQEVVRIKNETWERTEDLSQHTTEKVYEFDYINNIIRFGDNVNGIRPDGDIEIGLARERVLVSNDSPRLLQTQFSTDGVKDTTSVYRLDKESIKNSFILRKEGTIHSLGVTDVQSINIVSDPNGTLSTEQSFVNGATELSSPGDYSIDYMRGDIYTYEETPPDSDIEVNVFYKPRIQIENFSFENGQIEIPEDQYVTEKQSTSISIASPTKVVDLGYRYVEPRSLRFLTLTNLLTKEVPFKGDGTEFDLPLSPSQLNGYYTVDYKRGKIFTYNTVSGTLVAEFNTSEYYAEYNIAVEIPREDYSVDFNNSVITLSDRYVIKNFSNSLSSAFSRNLFKVNYVYAEEIEQNPRELEPFFTPLVRGYQVSALTRDKL